MLKYSGDARFWSTYPPGHREYRALPDPPPPTSPYHKHGGVIARLELLDALVCFTYSIWNRDYSRRACVRDTWKTIEAFLVWCKQKWHVEEGINDAEKAFLGLIWMIEAFIQGRQLVFSVRSNLDGAMDKVHDDTAKKIAAAVVGAHEGDRPFAGGLLPNGKAPPMLPSPSSTNSTPVNRDDGTPSTASNRPAQAAPNGPPRQPPHVYTGSVPHKLLPENLRDIPGPIPQRVIEAMEAVTEPITPTLVQDLKDLTAGYHATAWCTQMAQQTLNLPLLRRCFPNTWARMMHSTLLPTEEHEPDFEDEEGELYWPDQR
ncbi:hypothetical protein NLJ89_g12293 [Agrocybe chaxingu]|uniref:Uncharacterized protein n=1 Tax=Agrocybe chaxingu TaxID=84603 RepID=A0A9W8JK97_9AGAR|nr:hypothetical protein NLJ89_g12293 [Agrocybe chaxingu]